MSSMPRRLHTIPALLALVAAFALPAQSFSPRTYMGCEMTVGCPVSAPQPSTPDHSCCAASSEVALLTSRITTSIGFLDCCIVRPAPVQSSPLPQTSEAAPSIPPLLLWAYGSVDALTLRAPIRFAAPQSVAPPWLLDAENDRAARGPPSFVR